MSVNPEDIAYVEIFPPIAVARVGDSDQYYMGPQVPGVEPIPEAGFRDDQQRVKRQAARYRVYAYDSNDNVLGEIVDDGYYTLQWKVHVANKKCAWVHFRGQYRPETWKLRNGDVQGWPNADRNYEYTDTRNKLIIDSGTQTIEGTSQAIHPLHGQFYGSKSTPVSVHLGDILTDEHGRLVFLAGDGKAHRVDCMDPDPMRQPNLDPGSAFESDDWFDSMCDGKVDVVVTSKGTRAPGIVKQARNKSTIITAPPRFAPGLHCPTTLYELIEDVYERSKREARGEEYDVGPVDFHKHILPLFQRLYGLSWTNIRANEGHGPRRASFWLDNPELSDPSKPNKTREYVFGRVRAPVKKYDAANEALRKIQAQPYYMPRMGGNNSDLPEYYGAPNDENRWMSLTELQHDRLAKWAKGEFTTGSPVTPYPNFESIPLEKQPEALTEAALEWSVGAPLYPGIEVYWVAEFTENYNLQSRFRFSDRIKPGDLGKGLALPWHSDFYMCNTHWWPSIRPDDIVTDADFKKITEHFQGEPAKVALNLTNRTLWDNGLYRKDDDDDILGCSEMIRKWNRLGFIVKKLEYGTSASNLLPVHIETDRRSDFPHTST